jgi:hypothetical protein
LHAFVIGHRAISISRATGAITKYKKALGDPVGLAELLVFTASEPLDSVRKSTLKIWLISMH